MLHGAGQCVFDAQRDLSKTLQRPFTVWMILCHCSKAVFIEHEESPKVFYSIIEYFR